MSGGMDSTINLGLFCRHKDFNIECLSFDYGQRHKKELEAAKKIAKSYGLKHEIIKANYFEGCALVGDEILEDGPSETAIVPNRNMVFLSIAAAYAVQKGAKFISWSVVKDDADIFQDCRSEFLKNINNTLRRTTGVTVLAPFIAKTKIQIVKEAKDHGIDFSQSWSCYKGGEKPCGVCGACILREEAVNANFGV